MKLRLWIAAIFFTVCAVDMSLWRGVVTGKYFYFAAAMCIAALLWSVNNLQKKPVIRSADIAFAAFAVYTVFRQVFADGFEGGIHWRLFLLMIPLYVMIRSLPKNTSVLANVILVFALIEAVWGIMQQFGWLYSYHHEFRVTGSLFNPGPYAGFIAMCLPIVLSRTLKRPETVSERVLAIITLLASLFILPFTESRAAWFAAAFGVVFVLYTVFGKRTLAHIPRGERIAGAVVGAALALALLYGAYHLKKDSADGRLLIWKVCVSIIEEYPLTGVGYGSFTAHYGNAQADWFAAGRGSEAETMVAGNPAYAFNEWIHIAVELGLVGLFLFGSAVFLCLGGRRPKTETGDDMAYRAALISFCVFATFSYPFDVLPLVILFVVLVATVASYSQAIKWQVNQRYMMITCALCFTLTVFVSSGIIKNRPYYAYWREAQKILLDASYSEALEEYEYLFEKLRHEKLFLMEYARCLAHARQYVESNRILALYLTKGYNPEAYNYMGGNYQMMEQYALAEQAYIRSAQIIPGRLTPLYMLMRLYLAVGKTERAVEMARILTEMPVKIPSPKADGIKKEAQQLVDEINDENSH